MTIDFGNLEEQNLIPNWLKKIHLAQIDDFDNKWKPVFQRIMEKRESPALSDGGSGKEFSLPWGADPQMMAKYHDPREQTELMAAPHLEGMDFWHRTIKNGYPVDLEEFAGDFKDGVISYKRKKLDENLVKACNRTIEYTLCRYVYGDAVVMNSFSNQGLARQARANIAAGTFRGAADAHLGGQHWGIAGANIFSDLNYLKDRFELMADVLPEYLIIGRVTTRDMENNNGLLNRLINIKDTTQGVLGEAIQGLKIMRVVGQTYKDVPGLPVGQVNMPGQGDYTRQTWTNLNKIDMMSMQMGAQRWEWGMITDEEIGFTSYAWTHLLHQRQRSSPTEFYMNEVVEHDPLEVKNLCAITVCPVVEDFSHALILDRTCPQ